MFYKKSYLTAREESNRRLGRPYKFRGAIVDLDNNDEALKLNVPDLRDGLMTSPNKNKKTTDKPLSFIDRTMDFIVASNDSLSKLVSENPMRGEVEDIIASFDKDAGLSDVLSGEGTSTRALTIDGEPVNMLDKGDDVNFKKNLDNPEYGKKLFQDIEETLGLEPHQVAGLVGNFDHETGGFKFMREINPVVKGSKGGINFAQWTGTRHDNLLKYAKENNLKPESYAAGFGFFIEEVQNTREGRFLEKLQAASTVEEAATIVSEKYLRPGKPMLSKRIALAKSYLED
tara:strand:+ start:487 stop:1347 length:861 start_codon:yes stop_codon:yes gene_type:complete